MEIIHAKCVLIRPVGKVNVCNMSRAKMVTLLKGNVSLESNPVFYDPFTHQHRLIMTDPDTQALGSSPRTAAAIASLLSLEPLHREDLAIEDNKLTQLVPSQSNYNPRKDSEIPRINFQWERTANPLISPMPKSPEAFRIPRILNANPQTVRAASNDWAPVPPPLTYANSSKSAKSRADRPSETPSSKPRGRRPNHRQEKGMSKAAYIEWANEIGIPQCKAKIAEFRRILARAKTEKETLDSQMLAIGAMHGTTAFEDACYKHLTSKVKIENELKETESKLKEQNGKHFSFFKVSIAKNREKLWVLNFYDFRPILHQKTGSKTKIV